MPDLNRREMLKTGAALVLAFQLPASPGPEPFKPNAWIRITPDNRISRIVIDEVDGSTTEYRFTEQKENVGIGDERFRFTPPPGVETIDGELGQ